MMSIRQLTGLAVDHEFTAAEIPYEGQGAFNWRSLTHVEKVVASGGNDFEALATSPFGGAGSESWRGQYEHGGYEDVFHGNSLKAIPVEVK